RAPPAAEPTDAPAPEPATQAAGSDTPLDVDDVIVAWSEILPDLPVATRTAVQNAQPLRVDGDVVVFGVPPSMIEAAKPRFKKEADTIRAALAGRLGRSVRFNLEPAEEFSLGGAGGASRSDRADATVIPTAEGESSDEDFGSDVEIDLSRSGEAALSGPAPVSLLQRQLGATVVE